MVQLVTIKRIVFNKHESAPVDLDYLFDAAGGMEADVRELVELLPARGRPNNPKA